VKTEEYKGWEIEIVYDEKWKSGYAIARKGDWYLPTKSRSNTTEYEILENIKRELDKRGL